MRHLPESRFEECSKGESNKDLNSEHQNPGLIQHILDFVFEMRHGRIVTISLLKGIGFGAAASELFAKACGYRGRERQPVQYRQFIGRQEARKRGSFMLQS